MSDDPFRRGDAASPRSAGSDQRDQEPKPHNVDSQMERLRRPAEVMAAALARGDAEEFGALVATAERMIAESMDPEAAERASQLLDAIRLAEEADLTQLAEQVEELLRLCRPSTS